MPSPIAHSNRGKATLICQECGHESPIEGDWNVSEPAASGDRRVYECPDCGAVVLSQPVLALPA